MFGTPDIVSGYQYYGSFAVAVCVGPVKKLNSISNGDTVIFTGPIDIASADADGKSTLTTSIGAIDFYWGSATQNVNTDLAGLEIDFGSGAAAVAMTAYRRLCYAVCRDVSFGNQVSPPTLKFDVEREISVLTLSQHSINGDCVMAEAIYDYLTNTLYGAGLDPSLLDAATFEAAGEALITEGLGASPSIDAFNGYRDEIGKMLQVIDAVLYWDGGKLKLKLIRVEDTSGAPTIAEADLLDEPMPTEAGFKDCWNLTRLTFRDRDQAWQEDVEPWADAANAALTGLIVPKEFNMPWITTRSAAKVAAKVLGIKGGIPPIYWELRLKPAHRTLVPGELIKLSYTKLGIADRLCRISQVERGGPDDLSVTVTCYEDQARDPSHDYVPPADDFTVPGTLDTAGRGDFDPTATTPRISSLPEALRDARADGILLVGNRPDRTSTVLQLWWTWDPGFFSYQKLTQKSAFPAKGTVLCFWRINAGTWLFRVTMDTALDYDSLAELVKNPDLLAVLGERIYNSATPKDQHQVLSPWLIRPATSRFTALTSSVIDIELESGHFGTNPIALENGIADASYPTAHVYFGQQNEFVIFPSQTIKFARTGGNNGADTNQIRYIKAPVQNPFHTQTPSDVTAVTLDRDDATQCPDGTFSRDWGSRAPTAYEYCDAAFGLLHVDLPSPGYSQVADLDIALAAVLAGTATSDQALLVAHIDAVLGKMAETLQTFYSDE